MTTKWANFTWRKWAPWILALALYAIGACAILRSQEKPEKPAPAITIEQQAEWLQARAELAEARIALSQAEARYNAIVSNLQSVCPLALNAKGRPECVKLPIPPPGTNGAGQADIKSVPEPGKK